MKMTSRSLVLVLISVAFLFLAACDKTKLEHSWADPDAANYTFTKPLAVAVLDNEELRSIA